MAEIIYKEGHEGQNRLDAIEGIKISLYNGQSAIIYPKYQICKLLKDNIPSSRWAAKEMSELEAIKQESAETATTELYDLDSPAAKHVRQFVSNIYGTYNLPTLLAAMEIFGERAAIDELASGIKGADLLKNFYSPYFCIWSCIRESFCDAWFVKENHGNTEGGYYGFEFLAIPTILSNDKPISRELYESQETRVDKCLQRFLGRILRNIRFPTEEEA